MKSSANVWIKQPAHRTGVVAGNYSVARDLIWPRVKRDGLDYPFHIVFWCLLHALYADRSCVRNYGMATDSFLPISKFLVRNIPLQLVYSKPTGGANVNTRCSLPRPKLTFTCDLL